MVTMRRTILAAGFLGAAAGTLLLAPRTAAAQTNDFATCAPDLVACDDDTDDCCYRAFDPVANDRAIIVPLDRCHQVVAQSGKYAPPPATAPAWCADEGPYASNDQ